MSSRYDTLTPPPGWRYQHCAVNGCNNSPRTWSRYCTRHAQRVYRTGDPNGRVFRDRELRPHAELAAEFLERWKDKPAVIAAHDFMAVLLESPNLPASLRHEMERLQAANVEPRAMLVAMLSVFGLEESHPHSVCTERVACMNLGRAVLATAPFYKTTYRSGTQRTAMPRATVCIALGQVLREKAGVFGMTFVRRVRLSLEGLGVAEGRLREASREFYAETFPDHSTGTDGDAGE